MTAPLPMGGQKITGMADPALATDGATKNYVDTSTAAFFSTGDVKLTIKVTADTGWVLFDDGTIGSASSGASNRANADTQALFTLIFNNISDTYAPILTSGGGATTRAGQTNAATAWAANCRISLTKVLGRALGVAGAGSGLSARPLGATTGGESVALGTGNLPPYTPTGSVTVGALVINNFAPGAGGLGSPAAGSSGVAVGPLLGLGTGPGGITLTGPAPAASFAGAAQGGTSTPFSIMNPTSYFNAMIKL